MRVVLLVTGSRLWDDAWSLRYALESVVADAVVAGATEMVIRLGAGYPNIDPITRRRPARCIVSANTSAQVKRSNSPA